MSVRKIGNVRIRENGKLLVSAILFIAVVTACVLYIHRTTVPLARYEIGPAGDTDRWRFTLTDGTPLQPQDGRLPIEGTDAVVVCETELSSDVRELPLIVVTSKSSDCVFFLDGQLLYSPSGRYRDGGFSVDAFSTASGQFGLPVLGDGRRLTMIVQFQGSENRLSRMPKLTLYPSALSYYSQHTSSAAADALPAGMYFTIALFLMGLFLIGLWKHRSDPGLLLLAFCALSMAFLRTNSYSYGVMALFNSPTITWFSSELPQAAMSWILWYRLSKKPRLISLPVVGLPSAAMLALLLVGLDNLNWVKHMHVMTAWILPAAVLIMLIAAAVDAAMGNAFLRRFFRYFAWSIPVAALTWVISLLTDGKLAQSLKTAFTSLTGANPTLFNLCGRLCTLLLILCFIQAVLELISGMARQDAELQATALRERYAVENLEIMRQSQEETRRQRHEMRHHLVVLDEFLSQGKEARAKDYTKKLLDEIAALPTESYSEHLVVNAVAGHYLNMAKAEGIRTTADVKAGTDLPLEDGELCVLLSNLLENALEACRAMKREQDRFISLSIRSDDAHMHISCENSTGAAPTLGADAAIPSSKPDAKDHGYGIPAIRRIVEKHFGMMNTGFADGRFSVKITI